MTFDPKTLRQWWPKPAIPKPIVIFGASSIVGDAHLPAYKKAGFPVAGIFDPNRDKTEALASQWGIRAFASQDEALAVEDAVFDLATPPAAHATLLNTLPRGAFALIQKPMGSDLAQATEILRVCRERNIQAAFNFQLRFAPMMLALTDAVQKGHLGELVDFDALLALATPWGLWPFLKGLPRIEIAMHSIHYFDFIRGLLGNPLGMHAKTIGHPNHAVAQTRTAAILDYGEKIRCVLSVNHDHDFGRKFQACEFRICGTKAPPT
jgi:predicted dehydrogenase